MRKPSTTSEAIVPVARVSRKRERPLKSTRAQKVTENLREMILKGTLAPGSHLQEEMLAEKMGTSRTPIRAALSALAQESLLHYLPNRGYQVPRFTMEDIVQAYEVRGTLEGAAARMLAERGLTPSDRDILERSLSVLDDVLAKGRLVRSDQALWREMNVLFHATLRAATHNRFFVETLETVSNIPMVSNALVQWYDFEHVKNYHADHRVIFEAICDRQGTRAEALMREHIHKACTFINQSFGKVEREAQLRVVATLSDGQVG
jgi:GntR family transcriptional regulator of vanillate catabolism